MELSDNRNDKFAFIACNLCGSNDYTHLAFESGKSVVRCNVCSLIYRNPRSCANVDREAVSKRAYGSYLEREGHISSARQRIFSKALKLLDRTINSPKRAMLDIGCGQGYFLNMAKNSGWQVKGIELVKSACGYAREKFGIDVINKVIEEANLADNSFDAITLWNVFDHLNDPQTAVREIKRLLKPNGMVLIRVPNISFHLLLNKVYLLLPHVIKKGKIRNPSVVINYGFDQRTLKRVLEKGGFSKIKIYNSWFSYGDPYGSFTALKERIVNFTKYAYFTLSQLIYFLSCGKVLIGSSLSAIVRK